MSADVDQFMVDWEQRIDFERLRKMRLERANAIMKKHDFDALILFRRENTRYLTSYHPLHWVAGYITKDAVILVRDSEPILYAASPDVPRVEASMPWIAKENLKSLPHLEEEAIARPVLTEEWPKILKEHGVSTGKIGLDASTFTILKLIQEGLPHAKFDDGDKILKEARMLKNSEEIKLLRISCMVAEMMIYSAVKIARPGLRENDVAAEAIATMYRFGGEELHGGPDVVSGRHTMPLYRMTTDKVIRYGDLLFLDLGTSYCGYYSDLGNTVVVGGKPSEKQVEIYNVIREEMTAAFKKLQPGRTTSEVNEAARGYLKETGYSKYGFFGLLGHGLGTSVSEYPIIGELAARAGTAEALRKIEPGMVVSMEPTVMVPGHGGIRDEEMFVVTETGSEMISKMPHEMEQSKW
jgi:Xaa-Pro aminopeptidase